MRKFLKILLSLLCLAFAGVFLFSGYKLYGIMHEYKVAEEKYDSLTGQFVTSHGRQLSGGDPASLPQNEERSPIAVDFDKLLAQNPDVVGWIYSPDTAINYPVVRGSDNDYYLHRFLDGSYNAGGTIFMDCVCQRDFSSDNSILYGHHMNDGSMFASIRDYWREGYYEAHPVIYLNTPGQNYKIQLFTAFVTDADSEVYTVSFPNEDNHRWYLNWTQSMSNFKSEVVPAMEDKLVTLSTCTYEFENARYVVQGILTPIG